METIYRTEDAKGLSSWEYLGTLVKNGMEFIILQPLDETNTMCYFLCDEEGYHRVENMEMKQAMSRRFGRTEMEEPHDHILDAR